MTCRLEVMVNIKIVKVVGATGRDPVSWPHAQGSNQ